MKKIAFAAAFVVVSWMSSAAQSAPTAPATPPATAAQAPIGTWRLVTTPAGVVNTRVLSVGPNGVSALLDDKRVSVEFAGGSLTFATADTIQRLKARALGAEDDSKPFRTVNRATLKSDGTLEGSSFVYIAGYGMEPIKRFDWTGTRLAK